MIALDEMFRLLTARLPDGWSLRIEVKNSVVDVNLYDPKGVPVSFNRSGKIGEQLKSALMMAVGDYR